MCCKKELADVQGKKSVEKIEEISVWFFSRLLDERSETQAQSQLIQTPSGSIINVFISKRTLPMGGRGWVGSPLLPRGLAHPVRLCFLISPRHRRRVRSNYGGAATRCVASTASRAERETATAGNMLPLDIIGCWGVSGGVCDGGGGGRRRRRNRSVTISERMLQHAATSP